MVLNLDITETMRGWIARYDQPRSPFSLTLTARAPLWSSPLAPRPFTGEVALAATQERIPVTGTLTLLPTGPRYDFTFTSAHWGTLRCYGAKHYSLGQLHYSLVTCELTLEQDGKTAGAAELQYRKPLWRFPLESLRLSSRSSAGRQGTPS